MNNILVIMPIYNTVEYLRGAIESVLQQIDINVHLVMVDDCSTDGSLNISNEYADRENVTVLTNEINRGAYYSRNRGLELLNDGNYNFFTVHDSDDLSDICRYQKVIESFDTNTNIIAMQTSYVRLEEQYIVNNIPDLSKGTYRDTGEGIAIYKKEVFDELGYYDNTRFSGDTDYWMRTQAYCMNNSPYKVSFFKEPLYIAIKRENNLSAIYTNRQKYWKKISDEVKQMQRMNNFQRNKFD